MNYLSVAFANSARHNRYHPAAIVHFEQKQILAKKSQEI